MADMVIRSFERLSRAAYGGRFGSVVAGMKNNEHFPMPWWDDPEATPTPASLKADYDELMRLEERAASGDKAAIARYWMWRRQTERQLRKLATYTELQADGDRAKMESTGFALRRPIAHTGGLDLLTGPQEFSVRHGGLPGMVVARARPVKGAGSYELQVCTGDDTAEANWRMVAQIKGCRRIEVHGLTPGTRYKFRLRAIGSRGPGAWSSMGALMAL